MGYVDRTIGMTRVVDGSLDNFLAAYAGQPVFKVPMVDAVGVDLGNNGDRLIEMGGDVLLATHQLRFVDDPSNAALLIVRGNGAMVKGYRSARSVLEHYWNRYPSTPLLMLPSSFYFPDGDFMDGLSSRTARVSLFCREKVSYEQMTVRHRLPPYCEVGLDHDTAFLLRGSDVITALRPGSSRKVLIVERTDREHPSGRRWQVESTPSGRLRHLVPLPVKRAVREVLRHLNSASGSAFSSYCEERLAHEFPELAELPRVVEDISDPGRFEFEEFCQVIADAEVVFTTRLHVAILGALLGKQTFAFEGPYHKIRAIHEHSMRGYRNVTLVSRGQFPGAG